MWIILLKILVTLAILLFITLCYFKLNFKKEFYFEEEQNNNRCIICKHCKINQLFDYECKLYNFSIHNPSKQNCEEFLKL